MPKTRRPIPGQAELPFEEQPQEEETVELRHAQTVRSWADVRIAPHPPDWPKADIRHVEGLTSWDEVPIGGVRKKKPAPKK